MLRSTIRRAWLSACPLRRASRTSKRAGCRCPLESGWPQACSTARSLRVTVSAGRTTSTCRRAGGTTGPARRTRWLWTAFAAHALLDAHQLIGETSASPRPHRQLGTPFQSREAFGRDRRLLVLRLLPGVECAHPQRESAARERLRSLRGRGGVSSACVFARAAGPMVFGPDGEGGRLDWVDGYHTAFILWVLAMWPTDWRTPELESASSVALDVFVDRLIDADGAARRWPRAIPSTYMPARRRSGPDPRSPDTKRPSTGGPRRRPRWTLANMQRADGRLSVPAQAPLPERRPLLQVERRAGCLRLRLFCR